MMNRALRICSLSAQDSRLRVAVVHQILCGKDIRLLACGGSLPIGGEQSEKIIVVGLFFCTCYKIVKERIGALVVAPEYREIALHRYPFPRLVHVLSL